MLNEAIQIQKIMQPIVQNRALRLFGRYDRYTGIEQLHSDNEIPMLKEYIKFLALKSYASAKASKNRCIQKLGSDSLVDNQRVPEASHVLR